MNDSIEYIDSHAQRVLSSFEKIISDEKDEKRKEELWEYMNEIKMLAISALKKFK